MYPRLSLCRKHHLVAVGTSRRKLINLVKTRRPHRHRDYQDRRYAVQAAAKTRMIHLHLCTPQVERLTLQPSITLKLNHLLPLVCSS